MNVLVKRTSDHRRALLGKVHIGKKALGWNDEVYRDVIELQFGKRSAADLTDAQLVDLVEHLKTLGFKPAPAAGCQPFGTGQRRSGVKPTAQAARFVSKVRALWIAGHNLGLVENPSESALAAFVERQTGLASSAWLRDAKDAAKVIEALKAWLAREGKVAWAEHENPRACVVFAQWRRLGEAGVLRIANRHALDRWLTWKVSTCETCVENLTNEQLDDAQRRLGEWLRRELARSQR